MAEEQEEPMVLFQGATLIERSVEDVFDFVADERNEPRYNPSMVRAEKLTDGPIGPGTHWAATVLARGKPLDLDIEVTQYERPRRLASTTTMSTADLAGVLTFERDVAGTRMSWSWELRPKGVYKLMGPLFARTGRKQETEIWDGLKRYLEGGRRAR
jgi:hypothetical protein